MNTLKNAASKAISLMVNVFLTGEAPEKTLFKATPGSAGYDICSAEDCTIEPGERKIINTGIKLEIPEGYVGNIVSRSGLAARQGIIVLNAPGIIDSDFRGEIKVILYNTSKNSFKIKKGDPIAQILFSKYYNIYLETVTDVSPSKRGDGGFGSTSPEIFNREKKETNSVEHVHEKKEYKSDRDSDKKVEQDYKKEEIHSEEVVLHKEQLVQHKEANKTEKFAPSSEPMFDKEDKHQSNEDREDRHKSDIDSDEKVEGTYRSALDDSAENGKEREEDNYREYSPKEWQ